MSHRKQRHFLKLRSLYLWHRYIGISAALFVVVLAVTGVFLNHTVTLKLDRSFISAPWLLNWYDIELPQRSISYSTEKHYVSLVEDKLYIDEQVVTGHFESLAGAIELQDIIIIAADTELLLFTHDGELIEKIHDINGSRALIAAIGKTSQRIAVQANDFLLTDIDFSSWQQASRKKILDIAWSYPTRLPHQLRTSLAENYRSNTLTLERVMLDLHSGRILGKTGVYLMDAAAIMLILLSMSGGFIWLQQLRKRRKKTKPN